ncbi:MAG: thiamine pyrophosphate-dependent enzyme [Candidatus Pararuminococcus gallinarum]|jgi:2-oxoglutarate ferredoxin oxidoreductase subunit beta
MPVHQKPVSIVKESDYCGGCGHGVIQRLIAESLEELGLADRAINVVDIACCFWSLDALDYDGIAGPHGRCAAVATAIKKVRPESIVFIHAGDGASYGIGLAETSYAAMRDIPITMIVVNNGIFGMTGGQMCPATTLIGDRTTSTVQGRCQQLHGAPADMLKMLSSYTFEFAARGALYDAKAVEKTKSYIKKGFENQRDHKGFSIIEVLSPCPTNWGLSPVKAQEKIKTVIEKQFPTGIFVDRGENK